MSNMYWFVFGMFTGASAVIVGIVATVLVHEIRDMYRFRNRRITKLCSAK